MLDRTLKSLLEDPAIAQIAPEAIRAWDLSKEEFYGWTLRKIADDMHWRFLERGFSRLFEIAGRGEYYYPLYSDEECESAPEKRGVNIVHFPSDDPAADERPFVFIVPGGGFENVWNLNEGWPIAQHFNARGYHAFILTYQVGVYGCACRAMDDIARAMSIINERAAEFRVDPSRYITCGFSSGGYIVCLWNTEKGYTAYDLAKPAACLPIYPFTSYRLVDEDLKQGLEEQDEMDEFARYCSGLNLAETCESCFEIPEHVEGFPPTAIFLTADDDTVPPEHSQLLAAALEKAGIPCRLEIGKEGGHGFADGTGMCMEGWPERALEWFEQLA